MNCPFCGENMTSGSILGDRYSLKWQPSEKPMVLGIWATGHKIGGARKMGRPEATGHRCASCRKIVVDE